MVFEVEPVITFVIPVMVFAETPALPNIIVEVDNVYKDMGSPVALPCIEFVD